MGIGYFIFGNVDSRDYGIEVFFKDVDRTPKRVYKSIEVPGRNGAVLIDENRYEDVPFSYDCVALDDTYRKAFVNALASQIGYKRMQDSFNEGEFYSAVFDGDVDPNVTSDRAKSTFTVYFTRAAQRFLTSGEEAIDVDSGDTITNPTLFEAAPMLEVEGYGEIGVNGDVITIQNGELGEIKISDATQEEDVVLNVSNLNANDAIYSASSQLPYATMSLKLADASGTLNVAKRSSVTGGTAYISKINGYASEIRMSPVTTGGLSFRKGWSHTYTTTLPLTIAINGTATNCTLTLTTVYNGGANTISLVFGGSDFPESGLRITSKYSHPVYYGSSTKVVLPSPMYIDLDLGEAYGEVSDEITSFNGIVQMPANPPTLKAGANEITFDNTITDLKVIPRWWKI